MHYRIKHSFVIKKGNRQKLFEYINNVLMNKYYYSKVWHKNTIRYSYKYHHRVDSQRIIEQKISYIKIDWH